MIKRVITFLLPLALVLAACQSAPAGTTPRPNRTRTRTPGQTATAAQVVGTDTPAPTSESANNTAPGTPQPTVDLQGYILTQAYSNFTPIPQATVAPEPTSSAATHTSASVSVTSSVPLDTPTQAFAAPASVVVGGPVTIAGAVNHVTCVIDGVGDCTATIAQGSNVYFTWAFGVQGSQAFKWGNAAVVIQRDGQPYKWFQANNSALPPPAAGQISTLNVGDQALFRGGLDQVQPGSYTAKLVMCLDSVEQCDAGTGWQDVGGDTVQFVVNS